MKLLVNGQASFDCIFDQIDNAKKSIEVSMFIWRNDRIGCALALHLLNAAHRGVKITIKKDLVGAIFEYSEETRQSFFHTDISKWVRFQAWFMHVVYPMQGKSKTNIQIPSKLCEQLLAHENVSACCDKKLKDHSKYYIFDDSRLILGGVNVEDKEIYEDVLGRRYHDYMLYIDNKTVVEELKASLLNGAEVKRDIHEQSQNSQVDFIINTWAKHKKNHQAREAIINRISQTKHSIVIVMAYLNDARIMKAIKELVERKVEVKIYMPRNANIQNDVNHFFIRKFMRQCGKDIQIYLCNDMIHAKLFWIDNKYINFGSMNFNKQALDKLQECNIGVRSDINNLNADMQASIDDIHQHSQLIKSADEIDFDGYNVFLERLIG